MFVVRSLGWNQHRKKEILDKILKCFKCPLLWIKMQFLHSTRGVLFHFNQPKQYRNLYTCMCLLTTYVYVAYQVRTIYIQSCSSTNSQSLTRPCVCHDSVCQDKLLHRKQETKQYLCSFFIQLFIFQCQKCGYENKAYHEKQTIYTYR